VKTNWPLLIKKNYHQVLLVFAFFFVMVFAGDAFVRNILEKRLRANALNELNAAEAHVRSAFTASEVILLNASHTVLDMLEAGAGNEEILAYARQTTAWISRDSNLVGIYGLYGFIRGELIDGIDMNPGEDYIPQNRPWYQTGTRNWYPGEAQNVIVYTPPYRDARTGTTVITAVKNITGKTGERYGMLSLDLDMTWLGEYAGNIRITPDGYGMILSKNLTVMFHPDNRALGLQLQELDEGFAGILRRIREKKEISGERITSRAGASSGVPLIAFFKPLYNGWYLGLFTPEQSYYRDLNLAAGVLSSLGFVMAVFLSYMLLRLSAAKLKSDEESKSKSNFLARMSHEIRTPMNAIIGMGELAMQAKTLPKMAEYVGGIKQAGQSLLSLINDILDFSKIEAGNLEITAAPYELASVLNDVINVSRVRITEKPVLFSVNVDPSIPNQLCGDEARLRQILLNLLSNAAKYTKEGFITFTVNAVYREFPAGNQSFALSMEVADSGIGIKAEELPGLFGDFVRLDTEKNRNIEGTGLGLAITRRLCQAMGGNITVNSTYGQGSVFTAVIPQHCVSQEPLAAVENPQWKNVLFCDERALYAESVFQTLEKLGVPVTVCAGKDDFLSKLESDLWRFAFVSSRFCADALALIKEKNIKTLLVLLADLGDILTLDDIPAIVMPAYAVPIANMLNGRETGRRLEKTAVRFTAPRAKALIVDDIATNLKVAEGLLAPYRMELHTCTSGREAVDLVKQHEYDIVFMDHMMPGMDGIEAAALIREWEKSGAGTGTSRRGVPIVALTANAISGMKEMFLSKGFNDYLSKPIEIAKLAEILALWIPKEKREGQAGNKEQEQGNEEKEPEDEGLVIPGVDVKKGIAMTGGTPGGYRQVLAMFQKDAEDRLPLLRDFPVDISLEDNSTLSGEKRERQNSEKTLTLFVTQVHALKSAAAAIGAAEVSAQAAALEAAGKAGETAVIREKLPAFAEHLTALVEGIGAALNGGADGKEGKEPGSEEFSGTLPPDSKIPNFTPPVSALLGDLASALETQKAEDIDRLLEELNQQNLDAATRKIMNAVSDDVLMAEYGKARETVEKITGGKF
jgi:signal transduction histidine kinase/CheY-like chemotaxis protein